MSFSALAPLADRAALFVALRQDAFLTALGGNAGHEWHADMAAGTITFTASHEAAEPMVARAHLIATLAPGPRSLLWAWAHPQGGNASVSTALRDYSVSTALRDYGTEHDVTALMQPELPFPNDTGDDLDAWVSQTAVAVAGTAIEITGRAPYFSAPIEGGTRAVFLLDTPLPPLTVEDAGRALPRLLSELSLSDARTSVWDLARLASWNLQWRDDNFSGAVVSDATGTVTFDFDEHARIVSITPAN